MHEDVKHGEIKNGKYFVLNFDFSKSKSCPDPDAPRDLERNLLEDIRAYCKRYCSYYRLSEHEMISEVITDSITVSLSNLVGLTEDVLRGENPLGVEGVSSFIIEAICCILIQFCLSAFVPVDLCFSR